MTFRKTPITGVTDKPAADSASPADVDAVVPPKGQTDAAQKVRLAKGILQCARQGADRDGDRPSLTLTAPLGSVELRSTGWGGQRWEVTFSDPKSAKAHPVPYAARFAMSHLDLLAEAVPLLPEGLVDPEPLSSRCEAERDFLKALLPEIFSMAQPIQDTFGDLLARLVYEIFYACKAEGTREAAREEKRRSDSAQAVFHRLPTGAALVDRDGLPMLAVVSDSPGRRTKRSVEITMADGRTFLRDMDRNAREGLCLLTPARAKALDSRLLSAHGVVEALRVNRGLEERFPDWA